LAGNGKRRRDTQPRDIEDRVKSAPLQGGRDRRLHGDSLNGTAEERCCTIRRRADLHERHLIGSYSHFREGDA
jgi:hypothetical protein